MAKLKRVRHRKPKKVTKQKRVIKGKEPGYSTYE